MTVLSKWGKQLNSKAPLPEYPRMLLQRDSFQNLNGIWEYQITGRHDNPDHQAWKEIVVPFAVGSKLSGTPEELKPNQTVWYRKQFAYHPGEERTILHFEAVDMECTVFLNGFEVMTHKGGYEPFEMDISGFVKYQNALMVRCIDDSDYGYYAYGKQKVEHGGMWYTPSGGIWGTVWLEDIPQYAVEGIQIHTDYDEKKVYVKLNGNFEQAVVTIAKGNNIIHSGLTNDNEYIATLEEIHPWSPEDPFLYDLYVHTEFDDVRSYFGIRKFAKEKDANGKMRFTLNHKPLFLTGLLDQGYSIDGLMTYPSEEAMRYELQTIKDMGYNMIRKHIKVECRRWYYLCDFYGILVMQDMPSGGYDHYDFWTMGLLPTLGFRHLKDTKKYPFTRNSEQAKKIYYEELTAMIHHLYSYTCIFAWCPFNEGWGQFDAVRVTDYIRKLDDTRLIDSASGWHDQGCGDFDSVHHYFLPYVYHRDKHDRISLLSEFGGYAYVPEGHSEPRKLYGYKVFDSEEKLNRAVVKLYENMIIPNIAKGLSGCIYTQVSDVEDECNGIMSADREVVKLDMRKMKRLNHNCIRRVK